MDKKKNIKILCLGVVYFDNVWERTHQIITRLAKDYQVIYVENPLPLASIFFPCSFRRWKKWGRIIKWQRRVFGMDIFTVIHPFPYTRLLSKFCSLTWFDRLNDILTLAILKILIFFKKFYPYIIWIEDPKWIFCLKHLKPKKIIYDCFDEKTEFFYPYRTKFLLKKQEKELMDISDLIIVSSEALYERRKEYLKKIVLIRNGVDFEHFSKASYTETLIPYDIATIQKPIIGFYGKIGEWVDINLLFKIASLLNFYSFVIIGDITLKQKNHLMTFPKNVYFLGRRNYQKLPNYIKGFDVLILPFKVNKFTDTVNPVKFYEYLATGKPIVATPIKEVLPYKDIVRIAKTPEEFAKEIQNCIKQDEKHMREIRIKESQKHTWDSRVLIIKKILDSFNDQE